MCFIGGVDYCFICFEGNLFFGSCCLILCFEFYMIVGGGKCYCVMFDSGNFFYFVGIWEFVMGEMLVCYWVIMFYVNCDIVFY